MGLCDAPAVASLLSGVLTHVIELRVPGVKARAYIDDVGLSGMRSPVGPAAVAALVTINETLRESGCPENVPKRVYWDLACGMLGRVVSSDALSLSLAPATLFKYLVHLFVVTELLECATLRAAVLTESLECLLGRLNWFARCTMQGRAHLHSLTGVVASRRPPALCWRELVEELSWWAGAWRGGAALRSNALLSPTRDLGVVSFASDIGSFAGGAVASLRNAAGVLERHAIYYALSPSERAGSSCFRELRMTVLGARHFLPLLAAGGWQCLILSDSFSNVCDLARGRSGDAARNSMIADLGAFCDAHGYRYMAAHWPREWNGDSDAIATAPTHAAACLVSTARGLSSCIQVFV